MASDEIVAMRADPGAASAHVRRARRLAERREERRARRRARTARSAAVSTSSGARDARERLDGLRRRRSAAARARCPMTASPWRTTSVSHSGEIARRRTARLERALPLLQRARVRLEIGHRLRRHVERRFDRAASALARSRPWRASSPRGETRRSACARRTRRARAAACRRCARAARPASKPDRLHARMSPSSDERRAHARQLRAEAARARRASTCESSSTSPRRRSPRAGSSCPARCRPR